MSATSATPIELLAPARNLQIGKAAIDCGADAVYIGAPLFGARQAAGNSIADIRELCSYARPFGVRVWVTLNTLLRDDELPTAEKLAWELFEAGADGLIIQDMGLLQCNLPPLRLHASTQCNNTTPDKVRWLQEVGFERVVLARELSLEQIHDIRKATAVELEAFVHGALCVCYSGQCYLSEALCGRSANRGECAQLCRLKYNLLDKNGNLLASDRHALSLHDMDRSRSLKAMLDAGITSLKIEGRLKGEDYVRNIVAFYRQTLDRLFAEPDSPYCRASHGNIHLDFQPNPAKTFHRGETDYFLHGRKSDLANWDTPKSTGEYIGKVVCIHKPTDKKGQTCIEIQTDKILHNGDGLCWQNKGFLINRAEGKLIYPNRLPNVRPGTSLYRNYDSEFTRCLTHSNAVRRLPVKVFLKEENNGFRLQIGEHEAFFPYKAEPAQKTQQAETTIRTQLGKLGDSIYEAESIVLQVNTMPFLPSSVLNEWRRQTLQTPVRQSTIVTDVYPRTIHHPALPNGVNSDYRLNILNSKAKEFYSLCGASNADMAFEVTHTPLAELMTCRYCLLHEAGLCRKQTGQHPTLTAEPMYLQSENGTLLRLHFNCAKCEMTITAETRTPIEKT